MTIGSLAPKAEKKKSRKNKTVVVNENAPLLPKSHVQNGGYECGYYVMHWMWSIFIGGFKNEWTMVYLL